MTTTTSTMVVPPPTMKAVIRTGITGYTFKFSDQVPVPSIGQDDDLVVVKVHAAAINPVDYKLPRIASNLIVGIDCCGTIVQNSSNANNTQLQIGDTIVGPAKSGSLAEYAIIKLSHCTKLPASNDWTTELGAALPVAYCTATTGFHNAGLLSTYKGNKNTSPPIESILIIGASGGCGLAAMQLAKGMSIPRIIGICSTKNIEWVKQNGGATEIIPYDNDETITKFYQDNKGQIDLIYDAASYSGHGEDYISNPNVYALLKQDNGLTKTYLTLNGSIGNWIRTFATGKPINNPKYDLVMTKPSSDDLQLAIELLNQANLKPIIDTNYSFDQMGIQDGFTTLKSRRTKGKIVYQISSLSPSSMK